MALKAHADSGNLFYSWAGIKEAAQSMTTVKNRYRGTTRPHLWALD
jgi:hypothetical protein